MESKKVKDMFDVKNTAYGSILFNNTTEKCGVYRKQRIKNKGIIIPPGKPIPYMWVDVVNLIEDDTWAELWMYRDDQVPITNLSEWVHPVPDKMQNVDEKTSNYILELGKYYAIIDMLEQPDQWYINANEEEVFDFYLEKPRDIWDTIKAIMGK